MTEFTAEFCGCSDFSEGDWVEFKLDTNQFGIVIGESDFGRYYTVQLAGSGETKVFHWATLRHSYDPDEIPPEAAVDDATNVVRVDFTKRRPLNPDTTTGGAA